MPVTLSCFAAEEKAGGELRLIGASGAPVLKLDGWRSIFGSCARLGASLPGRLHQLLDCSCLQKHGLCWFLQGFRGAAPVACVRRATPCFCFSMCRVRQHCNAGGMCSVRRKNQWLCLAAGPVTRLTSVCESKGVSYVHCGSSQDCQGKCQEVVWSCFCRD